MKVTALIFGILGTLSALTLAMYAYALGSLFVAVGGTQYGQLWQALSVLISIACVVGSGIVMSAPGIGGGILIGCGIIIFMIAGFNFLTFTTGILLLAGGAFGLSAAATAISQPSLPQPVTATPSSPEPSPPPQTAPPEEPAPAVLPRLEVTYAAKVPTVASAETDREVRDSVAQSGPVPGKSFASARSHRAALIVWTSAFFGASTLLSLTWALCLQFGIIGDREVPTDTFGMHPSSMSKRNPLAFAALTKIISPRFQSQSWIYRLEGTAPPVTTVWNHGSWHEYGSVCKPHDCGGNTFAFLIDQGGSRAVALLVSANEASGQPVVMGSPDALEMTFLRAKIPNLPNFLTIGPLLQLQPIKTEWSYPNAPQSKERSVPVSTV